MLFHLPLIPLVYTLSLASSAYALPAPTSTHAPSSLTGRQYKPGNIPYFPPEIPSCVACQPEWSSLSSCAEAAPAFQNPMNMIYNPLSFVSAIQCACTDTFSSAYPQCVDCFVQTNQCEEYLGVPSETTSSLLDGIRTVCGFGSALLGGVAASQSSAGISYTYNGVPNQGYPTSTSIGPGGIDYGSAQGANGASVAHSPTFSTAVGAVLAAFIVGMAV